MAKYFFQFLIIVFFSGLLGSCRAGKKAGEVRLRKRSEKFLLKKLDSQYKELAWFSAKAKIKYEDKNYRERFTANIRMRKDSIIWMNMKKAGIEGLRVMLTPDSVFMINRLDKNYFKAAMDDLPYIFALPPRLREIDIFPLFQDILSGNPFWFTEKSSLNAGIMEQQYVLSGEDERTDVDYLLDGIEYFLKAIELTEKKNTQQISINFDSYKIVEEHNFPYFRELDFESDTTGPVFITLKLSKVELNTAKKIKFEIPANYTRLIY